MIYVYIGISFLAGILVSSIVYYIKLKNAKFRLDALAALTNKLTAHNSEINGRNLQLSENNSELRKLHHKRLSEIDELKEKYDKSMTSHINTIKTLARLRQKLIDNNIKI